MWSTYTCCSIPKLIWIGTLGGKDIRTFHSIVVGSIRTLLALSSDHEKSCLATTLTHTCHILSSSTHWRSILHTIHTIGNVTLSTTYGSFAAFMAIPIGASRTFSTIIFSHWKVSSITNTSITDRIECWEWWAFGNNCSRFNTFSWLSHVSIMASTMSPTPILVLSTTLQIFTTSSHPD